MRAVKRTSALAPSARTVDSSCCLISPQVLSLLACMPRPLPFLAGMLRPVIFLLCSLLWSAVFATGTSPSLTSIDAIRRMSREQAAEAVPARIAGTCIYTANDEFFLHDGTHGIWVSSLTSRAKGMLQDTSPLRDLAVGVTLEVNGLTDPGSYARQVLPTFIRVTGHAPLPPPVRISAEQLVAGNEDGQLVELEGVVQDVQVLADRTVCSLMAKGVNCWIAFSGPARNNLPPLVDARVRAVGAFAPDFNNRSEAVLPKIICSHSGSIQIIKPPPADPFDSPSVRLNELRGFSPDVTLFHRKVTSGIITFVRPGEFFMLRDGNTCVRVASDAVHLQTGWKVDVTAFIDTSQHLTALKNGMVRKTGDASPPPPAVVSAMDLIKSASWQMAKSHSPSDLNGHTVTLRGRIRQVDGSSAQSPVTIWIESDNILFPANLPNGMRIAQDRADTWQVGALVDVTACCELAFRGKPDPLGLYEPMGLHAWLASAEDLSVIQPAPWWNTRRLSIALSGTAITALIAFGGIAMLRRQVKQQVAILSRELETKAVATERERMARDLHDTLEQQLTGVAMQLESLAKHPDSHPPGFSSRIDLASRMVRHSREEARRSVWDLRNRVLETHGLPVALQSLAESAAIDGGPKVEVQISGSPTCLEPATEYQLLRMAQEALANALKHAHASRILIHLSTTALQCKLVIEDDGVGLGTQVASPPGPPHFGWIGMHERASKIGATLDIVSPPAGGCTVTIQVPLSIE